MFGNIYNKLKKLIGKEKNESVKDSPVDNEPVKKKPVRSPIRKLNKKQKSTETSSEKKILDVLRVDLVDIEDIRKAMSQGNLRMTNPDFDILKKESMKKIKRHKKNLSKLKDEDSKEKIEKSLKKYLIKLKKIEKLL